MFGCGGSTNSSAGSGVAAGNEQPPANADAPPINPDAPPGNPDSPPGTVDDQAGSGAGGRLADLCRQVCSSLADAVDKCTPGTSMDKVTVDCTGADACRVPVEVIPCENELAAVLSCFIDNVATLCSADNRGQGQDSGQGQDPAGTLDRCADSVQAATSCASAHHIDLGSNMMDMTTDDNTNNCTTGPACTQCMCKATGNAAAKRLACQDVCTVAP